ncbi:hypothetical protein R3X27_04955 [Tropicimonas sp. TH_r6]|nr:hypothetical protein [Tropicimonas sp. TH_r6]MDV7142027.1 hypothetical protein [Tropicimonas sp. TH_r6]
MEFGVSGKTFEIIENDNVLNGRLGFDEGEQIPKAGALPEVTASSGVVSKYRPNRVASGLRVGTASMLLAFQPLAFNSLLG